MRSAASAAPIQRLTVASEQSHASATAASSSPSAWRSVQASRWRAGSRSSARYSSPSSARSWGDAALSACAGVTEIQLALPNRHHLLVDLRPFGLDNPNEVFVATDQPYGLIEARIRRT